MTFAVNHLLLYFSGCVKQQLKSMVEGESAPWQIEKVSGRRGGTPFEPL